MKNQTITRDKLKKIYDVACDGWKKKIESYASRNPFNSEIEFTQSEVDEMIKASDAKQTKVLREVFVFPLSKMDTIKSFDDACKSLGISNNIPDFLSLGLLHTSHARKFIAQYRLEIMVKALNDGWYPNWEDENENKYWNYFKMKGGFSYWNSNSYFHTTNTYVPSALYVGTDEEAQFLGNTFLYLFKDYILED